MTGRLPDNLIDSPPPSLRLFPFMGQRFLAQKSQNPAPSYGEAVDLVAQESKRKGNKKGVKNPAQHKCKGSELDICPDLILAALAAFAAAAFAVLFTQITMAGRKKRRKRSLKEDKLDKFSLLKDVSWHLGTVSSLLSLA